MCLLACRGATEPRAHLEPCAIFWAFMALKYCWSALACCRWYSMVTPLHGMLSSQHGMRPQAVADRSLLETSMLAGRVQSWHHQAAPGARVQPRCSCMGAHWEPLDGRCSSAVFWRGGAAGACGALGASLVALHLCRAPGCCLRTGSSGAPAQAKLLPSDQQESMGTSGPWLCADQCQG